MKKVLLIIGIIGYILSGCSLNNDQVSTNEPSSTPIIENNYSWEMAHDDTPKTFTAISDNEIKVSNPSYDNQEIIRPSIYGDNYRIFANIQVITYTKYSLVTYGFIPYFIDIDNYVAVYLNFNDNGKLKSIEYMVKVNSEVLGVFDFWAFKNLKPLLGGQESLVLERHSDHLTVSFMGISETKTIKEMNDVNNYIGIYVTNFEEITYSNYRQIEDNTIEDSPIWTETDCHNEQTFTKNDESNLVVDNSNNWMSGYLIKEAQYENNYKVSTLITTKKDNYNDQDGVFIGIVPFYQNLNNYLVIYLQWKEDNTLKSIGLTGYLNGEWLGWHDMWDYQGLSTSLVQGETIEIERKSEIIQTTFMGKTVSRTFESLKDKVNYSVGVWVNNTSVTFSNYLIKKL